MIALELPKDMKPFLWGTLMGALVAVTIGFGSGGWVTSTTAEKLALARAKAATPSVLTPVCARPQ